jgi:hypothetical protein
LLGMEMVDVEYQRDLLVHEAVDEGLEGL